MEKTVVVSVTRTFRHPLYKRVVKSTKKYVAHDNHSARVGDVVRIEETRPLSKRKRWRILEIVTRAK